MKSWQQLLESKRIKVITPKLGKTLQNRFNCDKLRISLRFHKKKFRNQWIQQLIGTG